jgi:DNA-binding transcriptional MerR regulator/effector-binding domain-containing protein
VTDDKLPIGRFARMTGLTVKALRHYDEIDLLRPARVDAESGYRYYTLAQARRAEAIRRLRSLELPLEEIRVVIEASPARARELLAAHRARLEERADELRLIVGDLTSLIQGREELVPEKDVVRFELHVEEKVPEQRVLVVEDRAPQDEISAVIPRQIMEVGAYLKELGVRPAGPPLCITSFPDDEGVLVVTTGWPVTEDVRGCGRIEGTTLPATRALVMKHTGPYSALPRSYKLLEQVMADNGLTSAGDTREIYLSDPEEVPDPNDYETLIVWPIGPEGELKPPEGDYFKRRVEVNC